MEFNQGEIDNRQNSDRLKCTETVCDRCTNVILESELRWESLERRPYQSDKDIICDSCKDMEEMETGENLGLNKRRIQSVADSMAIIYSNDKGELKPTLSKKEVARNLAKAVMAQEIDRVADGAIDLINNMTSKPVNWQAAK